MTVFVFAFMLATCCDLQEVHVFIESLYGGLPAWISWYYWAALVIIVSSLVWLIVLAVRAQRMYVRQRGRRGRRGEAPDAHESEYLWVFMVPALNEETVIADSVSRLSAVRVTNKRILVINDGSDDATGEVLSSLTMPELTVLTRVQPDARQGKSEALNDAWRYLHREVLGHGEFAGWDTRKVIVVIVDADGRLGENAGAVAQHFADERVGGVQAQVRIYNRGNVLTFAQDLEFGIFGSVFQLGRAAWGTANMGGNGQFNRLAALDDVVVTDSRGRVGPWAEGRLTEDQDVGLRMIHQGWLGTQASRVTISQQGVSSLKRLYRQRTRWAQGGWQVIDLVGATLRNPHIAAISKWDQFWYLMTPVLQAWVGGSVALTVIFVATGVAHIQLSWFTLGLLYVFAAAPGLIGVFLARRQRGIVAFVMNLLLSHVYVMYALMLLPVVYVALARLTMGKRSWQKTSREGLNTSIPPDLAS